MRVIVGRVRQTHLLPCRVIKHLEVKFVTQAHFGRLIVLLVSILLLVEVGVKGER